MDKRRILIIDDDAGFLRTLKLGLEDTGAYEVRIEARAANGLSAARELQPDLILVDVIMPEMDGGDIVAQLEADEKVAHIPVVFLTSVAEEEDIEARGGRIGGYDFIAKSVGVERVLEQIERHLNKKAAREVPGGADK